MRYQTLDVLSPRMKRSLNAIGVTLGVARRKRRWSVAIVAERVGVARTTYMRLEKGDPTVSIGVYAMALVLLGFGDFLAIPLHPPIDRDGQALVADRQAKPIQIETPEEAA